MPYVEPTETDRAIAEGARISTPAGGEQENLLAEFRAIQAELGGPEDEEADAASVGVSLEEVDEEKAKAKATPPKGKDGKFVKADKAGEKTGTEGKLTVKERVELREERRKAKEALAGREQQLSQREAAFTAKEAALSQSAKARELYEAGDYDGAAKAAFGATSWNEMNDVAARAFASPEYKRVKALEERDKVREAERERERQANMSASQQAREQKILGDFRATLDVSLPKAEDETIAALAAEDPDFVAAVFDTVVAAARRGEDLDPIEVAEEIVESARARFAKMQKVFGGRPASAVEAARAATPTRAGSTQQPVKPHKHVSRSTATEASAPAEFENDQDWIAFGAKALRRAHLEDEASGRSANWG